MPWRRGSEASFSLPRDARPASDGVRPVLRPSSPTSTAWSLAPELFADEGAAPRGGLSSWRGPQAAGAARQAMRTEARKKGEGAAEFIGSALPAREIQDVSWVSPVVGCRVHAIP